MNSSTRRRKRRRWLRRILLLLLGGVSLVAGAGWLGLRHIPDWYRPVRVADGELQRVRDSLTNTFRDISDRIVKGDRFEISLTDQMVTEWCAARGQIWPDADEWLPEWLKDPMVAFTPGRIVLGARLDRGAWQSIVGAHFSIETLGDDLILRLEEVTAGALPIPLASLAGPVEQLIHSQRLDPDSLPDELARAVQKMRDGPALSFLSQGQRVPGPLIWKNGDRPYFIRSVQVDDGWTKLIVEPLQGRMARRR
ncbi:MAG: hypothetical protein ACE5GE_00070 [Phycisphaerae bacterium]